MRQVVALRNSVLDEGRRADKWQFEYDQMKEKCAVHLREKEVTMCVIVQLSTCNPCPQLLDW